MLEKMMAHALNDLLELFLGALFLGWTKMMFCSWIVDLRAKCLHRKLKMHDVFVHAQNDVILDVLVYFHLPL